MKREKITREQFQVAQDKLEILYTIFNKIENYMSNHKFSNREWELFSRLRGTPNCSVENIGFLFNTGYLDCDDVYKSILKEIDCAISYLLNQDSPSSNVWYGIIDCKFLNRIPSSVLL